MKSKWINLTILTNSSKYLLLLLLCKICLTINFCILQFVANIPSLYHIIQQYDMLYLPKHPRKGPGIREGTWSDLSVDWQLQRWVGTSCVMVCNVPGCGITNMQHSTSHIFPVRFTEKCTCLKMLNHWRS